MTSIVDLKKSQHNRPHQWFVENRENINRSTEILEDQHKPIIIIDVKEAPKHQKPIYMKDAGPIKGGFKRLGATDIRLTDSDIARYYQERSGSIDAQLIPIRW
jgi:hypothetical protein